MYFFILKTKNPIKRVCSVCVQRRENNYILGLIFSRVGNVSGLTLLQYKYESPGDVSVLLRF